MSIGQTLGTGEGVNKGFWWGNMKNRDKCET
jgi:hypothetical protein